MRVLAITNLFPNQQRPLLAPFNLQQFKSLSERCDLEVIATVPWFPGARFLGKWTQSGRQDSVPRAENYEGLWVKRPRTLYIPRLMALSGPLFAGSLLPDVMRYRGKIDVILAAWAYPDGCAAVALARLLGVPAVVKVHGSDINVYAETPGARPYLQYFLPRAARVVAVSRPLGQRVTALGVAPEKVAVIYNGVNSELFRVRDRRQARDQLGLPQDRKILLYVGNLKEAKGAVDLAAAFEGVAARQPDTMLVVVGDGAARSTCEEYAARIGSQMSLVGARPFKEIATWMAACDVLTLPSWNEGTPNVLLEAAACGRRVVASDVGGIPDLIESEVLGEVVPARDRSALTEALARAAHTEYDPDEVARAGARGDWNANGEQLHQVLQAAVRSTR